MRAWELLGLDEGTQSAGSRAEDAGKMKQQQAPEKPKKPKRIKPIKPEGAFTLKTN